MTKRRKVLNVERLNVEFERRKTEHRKIFHTILWKILKFCRQPPSWVVQTNLGDDDWT
jgi:hypothetical protein